MGYVPFFKRFDKLASMETRAFLIPEGHKRLPPGEYGFIELYCDKPNCDCRRVIFHITRSDNPGRILATVNFGWETAEFYQEWLGSPDGVEEMVGTSLEPFVPQSDHSKALLDLCKHALLDPVYLERIKTHYQLFRDSLTKKSNAYKLNPSRTPKISPNDYCPCGSNKKFKKCCGEPTKPVIPSSQDDS